MRSKAKEAKVIISYCVTVAVLQTTIANTIADPFIPDDPAFPSQWALNNVGQTVENDPKPGLPGADIRATDAWGIHQGANPVIVAIVGTGVNAHSEFSDRRMEGHSTVGDPYNSLDTWPDGPLGTLVAGVIAAESDNGKGIAGLSPHVRILPVRSVESGNLDSANVAEGIVWATDQGARVIVVPLQFPAGSSALEDAVSYATNRNVLVIAPTGKDGNPSLAYPARYENCLAVAATTHRDELAPFANYGEGTDLAAPGRDILSTWRDNSIATIEQAYGAAAGYVAGAIALILSYAPHQSPIAVADTLAASADDLGDSGWDSYFGHGRLNVARALQMTPPPPLRFERSTPLPVTLIPDEPTTMRLQVIGVNEAVLPDGVRLLHRRFGAPFVSVEMVPAGDDEFVASLPPAECEESIEFYFEALGDAGALVTDPITAPAHTYRALSIQTIELFYDDFEWDLGWTTVVEGAGTTGGWVRAVPIGTVAPTVGGFAQPDFDRSPDEKSTCFITGQNPGGSPGADDVDGGPVRLLSPMIELGLDDAEVSYAVWLHSSVGDKPDVLVVEITRDNGAAWHLVDSITPTEGWETRSFRLSAFPWVQGGNFRVRFSVSDLPSDSSLTEAGIDEVCVTEIRCHAADGDYDNNGRVDQVDFAAFTACMAGPLDVGVEVACRVFDFDTSEAIDLRDGMSIQRRFDP